MINDNIKSLRSRLGLNQEDFGKLFGLSKMTICHYERGRSYPSRKVANRIVSVMREMGIDIGLEYLLGDDSCQQA